MDAKVMKQRLEQWMPIFEEQAKSGIGKDQWCRENGIRRWEFYKRQRECRTYLLNNAGAELEQPLLSGPLPEFFELPAVTPSYESGTCLPLPQEQTTAGHIDIRYGRFDITITGSTNQDTLIALIKAVKNA